MNKQDFLWYLEFVLCPRLNEGDIVVMDNLRAHRSKEAMDILAKVGATARFLPAYSPEFNPIEFCWGFLKNAFRKLPSAASLAEVKDNAFTLWQGLRAEVCQSVIRHCGYAEARSV